MIILNTAACDEGKQIPHPVNSYAKFFGQAKLIRTQLGGKAYLLDNYLSALMEPLSRRLPQDAAADGFEAMGELFAICVSVVRGETKHAEHWFYSRAREYIQSHPLAYQEPHTLANIYCVLLSEEYEMPALERYLNDMYRKLSDFADECEPDNLYKSIGASLGGETPMDRLIWLFRHRFILFDARTAFVQGMNSQLLYCLTYRDRDTSRQVFQLLPE